MKKYNQLISQYSYIDFSINIAGNTIISILPVDNIRSISKKSIIMYFVMAMILFIIAEVFIYFKVQNISVRIKNITNAMNRVQNGDFKTIICEDKEIDEITLISKSFNNMCKQLDDHIKKVYVSEIKQKNAEMVAFQSQINPHFLYNTLESIRMKAIADGNKEIGKMLYNLAFLFRNMIKGKSKISLAQEIGYIKMYLQLFKFRYNDKFDYSINIQHDIEENEIIKFTIQPVIENFLVHGINLDVDDNLITINAKKVNNVIKITIQDNGTGINDEKIELINKNIKSHKDINSIGLVNVNERIKYQYGDEFGLFVENCETKGTKVTITIPIKGVENDV